MTDGNALENIYQEGLDEDIIKILADKQGITLDEAMEIYYGSKLANQISRGENGIQYLDPKVLVQVLCETELMNA